MVKTRAHARSNILEIIKDIDTFRAKQADEIAYQKRMGYQLTPEKRRELERQERVQVAAAKRRLTKLKDEYKGFMETGALPFSIEDGKVVTLTRSDMEFLQSLQYMPTLRATALKTYLEHYREENNTAMIQALCNYGKQNGFSVSGLDAVIDPDTEYKQFCNLLKKAEKVIDGAREEDFEQQMIVQTFREDLQTAWDDSLLKNADGSYKQQIRVTRKPTTPEEQIQQEFEQQQPQNSGDPIQEQVDATKGFLGEEAAAEFLESVALADMQDRKAEKGETAETYADKAKRDREDLSKEMIEASGGKMAFGSRS